jgi:hypothetical protein
VSWQKLLSVSPKQQANIFCKIKRSVYYVLVEQFLFFLSVCNNKEGFILYAPINLSFHSGQLDELQWGGPDIFTAESETRNGCEQEV